MGALGLEQSHQHARIVLAVVNLSLYPGSAPPGPTRGAGLPGSVVVVVVVVVVVCVCVYVWGVGS